MPKVDVQSISTLRLNIKSRIYFLSFYDFFVDASKILYPQVDWGYPPFYKYICDILQGEVERIIRKEEKDKDYIFNLPFRAGKSILLSQIFPVWCWIKEPALSIMQISHSSSLATKHSHASKILIESEWFQSLFPHIQLRQDVHAKGNYQNTFGGKRVSFGVQSGIIGEGCDIQICDDLNNPKDSQGVTQTINEIYTDTLYSRLNNPLIDIRIILQQRVSNVDICQYILDSNPNNYNHICLPVEVATNISPPEAIEFYEDNLLWGGRFTRKIIENFRSTLGGRAFSAQLMQTPVAAEGNIIKIKWINKIELNQFDNMVRESKKTIKWDMFVDSAYTAKAKENDPTAIILATNFNNIIYIRKAWNVWLEFPDLISKLKQIKLNYGANIIYIEAKASGLSIKQQLIREGFNCAELNPHDKDKISRANSVTPSIEGGHLCLIEDNSNEMVLQQLAGFPFGKDDIVDVVVYSIMKLLNNSNFNYGM